MIVYFTGTGNSAYCAQMLADKLQDECVNAIDFIRSHTPAQLISEKPWVFVAPTYAWQLPHVFIDFIRSSHFSGHQDAYFLLTCGNDIGNAAAKNKILCQEKRFFYRGTLPVIMPENYIAMFKAPDQNESQHIIAAARPVLEEGIACIQAGREIPPVETGILDSLKSGIVNTLFYHIIVKAKPFTMSDACISCAKCEKVCPLGNIQIVNGKPSWGIHCTHCMACICYCPTEAIEYGKRSQGKIRYRCPEYQN